MTTFLISYDLAAPQTNKHAIASAIMMLGETWSRPLEQSWYIRADIEERDIELVLSALLGDDDGLLVQAVERDAVLANTSLRWFKQRRTPIAGDDNNVVVFPIVPEPPTVPSETEAPLSYAEAS